MRLLRLLVLSMLAALLQPAVTQAQPLSEVTPGARVRIRAPGVVAGRYVGTVLSRTPDTLVVASSSASSVRVPIPSLASIEVSRGNSRARGAGKGALWGGGIGLGLGFLATAAGDSEDYDGGSDGELIAAGLVSGAFWGMIIGAIVGSERWDRYDLPARTSLLLPAASGRHTLGLWIAIGR